MVAEGGSGQRNTGNWFRVPGFPEHRLLVVCGAGWVNHGAAGRTIPKSCCVLNSFRGKIKLLVVWGFNSLENPPNKELALSEVKTAWLRLERVFQRIEPKSMLRDTEYFKTLVSSVEGHERRDPAIDPRSPKQREGMTLSQPPCNVISRAHDCSLFS